MFADRLPRHSLPNRFFIPPPPRMAPFSRLSRRRGLLALFCVLLLFAQVLSIVGWPALALAATHPHPTPASLTFQQFLHEGQPSKAPHGPFTFPKKPQQTPLDPHQHALDHTHLPPSTQPPTMSPIQQTLDATFLAGGATAKPLALQGSDRRLTVQIPPGAFDLSHAMVAGKPVTGSLTLTLTQQSGLFPGQVPLLGRYTIQLTDRQGRTLSGVTLSRPLTYRFHYRPSDLAFFNLDPGQLFLTFPTLIRAARSQHHPIGDLVVHLRNDAHTQTVSGQSHGLGPLTLGSDTTNQSPPTPHLASVGGNTGQLSYTYPLALAPAPPGLPSSLALTYSSESTNERHSLTSPAGGVGEGWSLSFGSITADVYTAQDAGGVATWYSLNNVAGVSDRLVPYDKDPTSFLTQHISPLKVQQVQSSFGQPCFNVWDANGTEYLFGCTQDSLQYYTKSDGTRVNYRWDLNRIILANEGPGTGNVSLTLSYLQDSTPSNGSTSIHDSVVWQATTYTSTGTVADTTDFFYRGRTTQSMGNVVRATAYGNNYNCTAIGPHPVPNPPTTLRCDDPVDFGGSGLPAPVVLSTYSLQTIQSYVGTDASTNTLAFSYAFNYLDHPYWSCWDDWTQLQENCAGDHLLTSVTPTVYLKGVGTARHRLSLVYNSRTNNYLDTTQHVPLQPSQYYAVATYWNYLTSYEDTATGQGASSITYQTAHNNTHGTPASGSDNRLDPLYCDTHSDCTGTFANPDDRAWTMQVVTQITATGSDSSAVASAQTTYAYGLQVTETASCPSYNGDARCVGDEWMPSGSSDFLNYYQTEYHGFANVYITSPAGDLTSQTYYSNADWGSSAALFNNYLSGVLSAEYVYQGNTNTGPLLRDTVSTYAGTISGENNSCNGNYSGLYTPCAVLLLISRTTFDEGGANANPPWVQQDNTFDDYANVPHAALGFGYNNLTTQVISSSNAASLTRKWTYSPNDQNIGGWIYHDVNKVTHSEVDDSTGKVWSCQNTSYDQGVAGVTQQPPTPAQGLPTTVTTYSDCANQNTTAITSYAGYNGNGEQVASVDGVGTANPDFYGSTGLANQNGCTLASNPAVFPTTWGKTNYTTCATYDSLTMQPTSGTNAFGQSSSTAYDPSQQGLPTSSTDANGQVSSLSYSYDSQGNATIQVSQPGETLGYTTQSSTNANACPASIPTSIHLPCYAIESSTALYSPAVSRTFYDALGRAVETRTTGPGVYDTVNFTVYNDATHTVFQSVPFQVVDGSGWLDPNGATDYTGHAPGGTASFYDALGRLVAVQDPLYGTGSDGLSCSATLTGTYTACTNYSLGSNSGDPNITDPNIYATTTSIDANNHVAISWSDALGRTLYVQSQSGGGHNNGTLSPIQQQSVQYNVLNEPMQVRVDDLAPQNNQVVTSVLTTAQYDSLGRLTQLVDPDRGTHTYSYDLDGHLVSDVSGSRTLGTNLDLLGRVGCVQDSVPVLNASGSCTSGSHPLVQNTYDISKLGTQGSTDFPLGRLTKSLTTTYFPEGGSATTTQKYQYDSRGRVITAQLLLKLPTSWNVSPGPPTYQVALSYTDTNQPTTAITSTVNPNGSGSTSTLVYDATGALVGLGSSSNPVANLATLSYNVNALPGSLTFLSSTGSSNVAQEQFSYDGNLRPFEATATWQSGSGSSGQIFDQTRSYDAAGNVISLTTTHASVPGQSNSGGSETENFCYDEQNRLVWAGNSGSQPGAGHGTCGSGTLSNTLSGAAYTNTFAYTNLGQLWHAPVNGTGGYQQYLSCDSTHPHQLTGIYPTGTTCTNPTGAVYSTSYDAWGNVTSRTYNGSTATLSYDQLDRMVEWQNSTTNAQEWYMYDASGNRVLRRSTTNGTTTLTTYPFGTEEHTYSGTGTLQSSTYYYRLGGRLIGELSSTSSQTNLFLTDALGSVLVTFSNTANTAALLGNQTYRPYGSQQYQSGSMGTNKGFTGHYADATGLDYYNARYYDPVAGVFLSADTVQGNAKGMNPYGYVQDNPETWSDPTGAYVACGDSCGQGPSTSSGGGGGGASSPASTSTNTGWLTFPFKIHPPTTPSTPNQNNTTFSPCGGMSIQDCMSLWYATGIHYQGYTTTSIKIGLDGPGFTLYGPTGLVWTGFHSSFTVQTLTPVSGTVVMPFGGCASLLSCLTSNEGVDERLPEDYALFQCSFTASTKVTTQEGQQAIGTLKPGEKVLAYNPKTHRMELQPILHVWIHHDHDLVDLTLTTRTHAPHSSVVTSTSEVIHTNQKHPFLTLEQGFLSVGHIKVGMHIVRADGRVGVVTGWKVVPGGMTMYNLEVQQDHTYTVGVGQWVVHNSGGDCGNIPWSSKIVKQAAQLLNSGESEVIVGSRSEAEELFLRMYQGDGYINTTDLSATEAKDLFGGKEGTYHWDDTVDSSGWVQGHGEDNPHGNLPHLQIHPFGGGSVIRIFFFP